MNMSMNRSIGQLLWIIGVLWASSPGSAQDVEVTGAEEARIQALVEAGVLPQKAILDARKKVERERLEQIVRETLMSRELIEARIPEMMRAAAALRDLAREDLALARKHTEAGVLPLVELKKVKEAADWAERQFELAERRGKLVRELALMVRAEDRLDELKEEDLAFSSEGDGTSWEEDVLAIDAAFFDQFGWPLPVSAQEKRLRTGQWGSIIRGGSTSRCTPMMTKAFF